MPTKPLERLIFAQGGHCFFCKQLLPKGEASVEHLVASANGGNNHDENCVACCKSVNALFGSMSLKEKIQVILNQKGQFKCPNGAGTTKVVTLNKVSSKAPVITKLQEDKLSIIESNLKQRGNSKPRTLNGLTNTIASLFPKDISEAELAALIQQLKLSGKVTVIDDNKVTYTL